MFDSFINRTTSVFMSVGNYDESFVFITIVKSKPFLLPLFHLQF